MKKSMLAGFFVIFIYSKFAFCAENAIAVMPFAGGDTAAQSKARGSHIAERISSFIAQAGLITVVERIQIEKAYKEISRGQSGAITESSAVEAGKMIGVAQIIVGSWSFDGTAEFITARIVDVKTGVVTASVTKDGPREAPLIDAVAIKLLDYLGISTTYNQSFKIKRTLAWASCAAALGCAGAVFWSHDQYTIADKNYKNAVNVLPADYETLAGKAQRFSDFRTGFAGGTIALLGTGITLFIINKSEWKFSRKKSIQGSFSPVITPRSIGLCWNARIGSF